MEESQLGLYSVLILHGAVFHYEVFLSEKQKRLQHRPLQTIKKHKSLTNPNQNNKTEAEKLNVLNAEEQKKREPFVT